MTTRKIRLAVRFGATVAAVAMLAAGCGSGSKSGGSKSISMGVIPAWTDQLGTAYLTKNILEANGYTVKITELSDNAPLYTAVSRGDLDLLTSAWIEKTQLSYWKTYGNKMEDLGSYYEGADSFLAVPNYITDVKSIADLPANAAAFNNTITGIEPGAGLTKMTQDSVIPAYGLDKDFKLQLSSTVAMLTVLKQAIDQEKPIVVTLWSPFWANSVYPVHPLEDPKGAYGKPENLHVVAHKGFSKEEPKVATMLSHLKLSQEQYESLENLIVNKFPKGKTADAVNAWLKDNPDFAPNLAQYLK